MTQEEKIIATAFTGKMFIDGSKMWLLYEYMEKKVGHGVIDLMLASKDFWEELHKACEQDFIDMISKEQLSLPSSLDEAAKECAIREGYLAWLHHEIMKRVFKAGAEWMKDELLSKITEEHLEGLRWIIRTGITTQPRPYHKYCKDLLQLLESYKNEI